MHHLRFKDRQCSKCHILRWPDNPSEDSTFIPLGAYLYNCDEYSTHIPGLKKDHVAIHT